MKGQYALEKEGKGEIIDTSSSKHANKIELVEEYIEELKRKGGPFYAVPLDRRGIEDPKKLKRNAIFRCCRCQKIPFEAMRCTGCNATVCKERCSKEDICLPQ